VGPHINMFNSAGVGPHINLFSSASCRARPWISSVINYVVGFYIYLQWIEVRGERWEVWDERWEMRGEVWEVRGTHDCWFYWYWLNCWPSLLNFLFINEYTHEAFNILIINEYTHEAFNILIINEYTHEAFNILIINEYTHEAFNILIIQLISINNNEWVSEWLLFNTNSANCQLYHDENKLIFNEMMMLSALY
jgi:hypothetical protein